MAASAAADGSGLYVSGGNKMKFNPPYGWESVRQEDVNAGYISQALGNAATAIKQQLLTPTQQNVEYTFRYACIKPEARVYYTMVLISDDARYGMHTLRLISHDYQLKPHNYIKSVRVHPCIPTADLYKKEVHFKDAEDYIAGLVIEIWSNDQIQTRSIVRMDELAATIGGRAISPADHQATENGYASISGQIINPEGSVNLPPMRVRLIDVKNVRDGVQIPLHPNLPEHEKTIIIGMHKALDMMHHSSRDFPRHRFTVVTRDDMHTHYTLTATGYSDYITLEDLMSVFMFNMPQIKEIHYDSSVVSGQTTSPTYRGGLVVKLLSNATDTQAPAFDNPTAMHASYRQTYPTLTVTLPRHVAFTAGPQVTPAPGGLVVKMPPPKAKASTGKRAKPEAPVAALPVTVTLSSSSSGAINVEQAGSERKKSRPSDPNEGTMEVDSKKESSGRSGFIGWLFRS